MISLLIAGAAALAGFAEHSDAKDKNKQAEATQLLAKQYYEEKKEELEAASKEAEEKLTELVHSKERVLNGSVKRFLKSYDRIKESHFNVGENNLYDPKLPVLSVEGAAELKRLTTVYSEAMETAKNGVAAGAVIALATNGSLALTGGLLGSAGSALITGNVAAAAGLAGSAVSASAAALTPLSFLAAPVILFTGFSASREANENLHKAEEFKAKVDLAVSQMSTQEFKCKSITERTVMFNDLLSRLDELLMACVPLLEDAVKRKESEKPRKFFGLIKNRRAEFTDNELSLIAVARSLAGAIKSVLLVDIIDSESGDVSGEAQERYDDISSRLPAIASGVENVKSVDYVPHANLAIWKKFRSFFGR